ncbi:hypothetical protein XBJ2_410003 [Xenorhabdus bovienii str. Jollieti]|uniref:DDE domain-containing protein n=1 Tax=Xenorhabdus bovienii (strain SS-2004) TaxID=406818 RepID=D3UWY6_XENBS|nr:hypothetical protein XBJ1_0830 [Xenorhabdus bovienii SS-2004]CDH29690.1 hypothetical protein XBJ2_410003 [Xenorhabdus bovienii str. Jollieti]
MGETYIKVKGQWKYLYRAVDTHGQTIDFLLTAHRDAVTALHFFQIRPRDYFADTGEKNGKGADSPQCLGTA